MKRTLAGILFAASLACTTFAQFTVDTRAVTVDGTTHMATFPIGGIIYTNGSGGIVTNSYAEMVGNIKTTDLGTMAFAETNEYTEIAQGDSNTSRIGSLETSFSEKDTITAFLPSHIYAAETYECNVYFDNLIYGDREAYYWNVVFGIGGSEQLNECWRYDATTVASTPLYIDVYDKNSWDLVASMTSTVHSALDVPGKTAVATGPGTASSILEGSNPINGWGDIYIPGDDFNQIIIPNLLSSTNASFYIIEYIDITIRDIVGDPADLTNIRNGSVVYSNRVQVGTAESYTDVTFDLGTTIQSSDFSGRMFIGYQGIQTNGTDWGLLGRCFGEMTNRDPTNESYYTYSSTNTSAHTDWFGITADTPITINLYNDGVSNVYYNVLCLGDSTGASADRWSDQLKIISTNDATLNLTMIGTRTTATYSNECVSGKTWSWHYSDADSAFTFGGGNFDFPTYISTNSFSEVDYVIAHLGINDIFGDASDAEVASRVASDITMIDSMISSVATESANTHFCIALTIPPSKDQDSFGANYGSGSDRARHKRNCLVYAQALHEEYADREGENIHIIPINTALDIVNNMTTSSVAVNARNATTIDRQNNGVHPDTSGYQQMADAIIAFLKNQ